MRTTQFCTVQEAAAIIDVSVRRIQQLVQQDRLEHIRLNGNGPILLDRQHVKKFARLHRPSGRPKKLSECG